MAKSLAAQEETFLQPWRILIALGAPLLKEYSFDSRYGDRTLRSYCRTDLPSDLPSKFPFEARCNVEGLVVDSISSAGVTYSELGTAKIRLLASYFLCRSSVLES